MFPNEHEQLFWDVTGSRSVLRSILTVLITNCIPSGMQKILFLLGSKKVNHKSGRILGQAMARTPSRGQPDGRQDGIWSLQNHHFHLGQTQKSERGDPVPLSLRFAMEMNCLFFGFPRIPTSFYMQITRVLNRGSHFLVLNLVQRNSHIFESNKSLVNLY